MPSGRTIKPIRLLLQCLITAAVLGYLLRKVPFADIARAINGAEPGYVVLALMLQLATRVPNAIRIKIIADAQALRLSVNAIVSTILTTGFYGLLLPGALAGGAASWIKYVQRGANASQALACILVNRATEILTAVSVGISFWIVDRKLAGLPDGVFLALATVALLSTYVLIFGRAHYLSVIVAHGLRLASLKHNVLYRKLVAFANDLARMRALRPGSLLAMLAASFAQELLGATALFCFAQALHLKLGFCTVAWMRAGVYLVVLLPLSVLGLGVREGTLVLLAAPYGVMAPRAMAWSFLIFSGTLVAALGGGLIEAHALWFKQSPRPSR
jgi:uncharacterized protein (TIRG00374 family)